MKQAGVEELADEETETARRVEVVHVREAVRVDAGEQRDDLGEVGKVAPVELDTRSPCHRHEMKGVVGRAAGRVEPDDAVHEHALVQHLAHGRILVAQRRDLGDAFGRMAGQRVAERRVGVDEAGPGQMEAHQLHQHLVRVRGAIEGAGAGAVIALRLRLEQRVAAELALGVELADARLLGVGHAGGHRPRRHEDRRQMAEAQRRHHEAGHDLVADAEEERAVEHVVGERHGAGERDHVAREERQLHAGLALGDPVAHGGHAACHLGDAAGGANGLLDQRGEALERLMGREHVVVGGDDRDVGLGPGLEVGLVVHPAGGEAVGKVAAGQA